MTTTDCREPNPAPLRKLLDVLWQTPLWSLPFALFFGTLTGGRWPDFVLAYKMSLVFAACVSLNLWVVRRVIFPRVLRSTTGQVVSQNWQIGLTIGLSCVLASYVAAFIIHFTMVPGFMGSPRAILISGMFALLFTGLFDGINFARAFYLQAVERARAVEMARAELARAELRALSAQINPHFLFNTLNSIAALIAENPAAAEETTTRLAEVFRYALQASEREHVPLGDELAFLRAYLEIESIRLGDRLRVEEAIEPGVERLPVPSLLLQPLVENAVLHGVAPRAEGGRVRITACREGERLRLEISDDGPGMNGTTPTDGHGFGLHSVRERLRALGPDHTLEIESAPGQGTRVIVTIPTTPTLPLPSGTEGTYP